MLPANLYINADDFGLDARSSLGIWQCAEENLIHGISIMAFQNEFHQMLLNKIKSNHPTIKTGIHLSLFGSESLSPVWKKKYRNAQQVNFPEFLALYFRGAIKPSAVYEEWIKQILQVKAALGEKHIINHLDTHQHIHILPGLWPIIKQLQKDFSIASVRIPYEKSLSAWLSHFPLGIASQLLARRLAKDSSARFIGFVTSGFFNPEAYLQTWKNISQNPHLRFELMVHPVAMENDNALPKNASKTTFGGALRENEISNLRKLSHYFK